MTDLLAISTTTPDLDALEKNISKIASLLDNEKAPYFLIPIIHYALHKKEFSEKEIKQFRSAQNLRDLILKYFIDQKKEIKDLTKNLMQTLLDEKVFESTQIYLELTGIPARQRTPELKALLTQISSAIDDGTPSAEGYLQITEPAQLRYEFSISRIQQSARWLWPKIKSYFETDTFQRNEIVKAQDFYRAA